MNDSNDMTDRRERMEALRLRRQATRGENDPSEATPGVASPGGRSAAGQRAKQFANLILKWMEATSGSGGETVADTGVSRDAVTKLMTMLSNLERRSGPGGKIAKMLRGFLVRSPQPGEDVIDGVNTEQLRKLIVLATRVRDQGLGQQKQVTQGGHRFWDGGNVSVGEGDDAAGDLDAAFESLQQSSEGATEPSAGGQPDGADEGSRGHEKKKQTKHSPSQASRKK
jgi:hypothetical protein